MANSSRSVFRLHQVISKVPNSPGVWRGLAGPASQSTANTNVPGLSANCVKVPNQPVGPGASKDAEYKNPEYFCYHNTSYFEAEIEMSKFRIPQPSSKK